MIGSHVPRLAAVIAGTLAIPAPAVCGEDEIDVLAWPQELQYGTRDSVGITIVESRRPESGSRLGWAVGDEPAVSIGTMEATAAYQLYRVADATRRLAHSRQFRPWQGCHLRPQRHPRAHHDPARGGRHSHENAG